MIVKLFSHAKEDRPLVAVFLLLIATFTLGLQDSLMKLMSAETSFWQIQTLRSIGNLCFVVVLARVGGGLILLLPKNTRGVYLRAAFLAVCMFFFFSGAPFLSVAQMAVGLYTYPLFICLMAGPILGETLGKWRISCIIIGSFGALLVVSPWNDAFSLAQLLPIAAGFFFACNVLTLRRACRHESTLALAFATAIVFVMSGLCGVMILHWFPLSNDVQLAMPFVAIGWPELSVLVIGFALLASLLNLTGNICMTRAYQTADASLLAPLDFSYLIFAAFWGRVIFGDWPTRTTLTGMAMIISAGAIIAWREQLANRKKANSE